MAGKPSPSTPSTTAARCPAGCRARVCWRRRCRSELAARRVPDRATELQPARSSVVKVHRATQLRAVAARSGRRSLLLDGPVGSSPADPTVVGAFVGVAVPGLEVVVVGAEAGEVVEGGGPRRRVPGGVIDLAGRQRAGGSLAAATVADQDRGLLQCTGGAPGVHDGADVLAVSD